jgi:hypothetical protein
MTDPMTCQRTRYYPPNPGFSERATKVRCAGLDKHILGSTDARLTVLVDTALGF